MSSWRFQLPRPPLLVCRRTQANNKEIKNAKDTNYWPFLGESASNRLIETQRVSVLCEGVSMSCPIYTAFVVSSDIQSRICVMERYRCEKTNHH